MVCLGEIDQVGRRGMDCLPKVTNLDRTEAPEGLPLRGSFSGRGGLTTSQRRDNPNTDALNSLRMMFDESQEECVLLPERTLQREDLKFSLKS